ncbi:hypothetical protein [Winogradskyella flava]|uniref:hypothetical protein n=1 Tax=Winogradskyella flava TaxID=1884876 RepID=UPI0024906090|nr:hypothetical protein [Winogradskyella flava]
MNRLKFTIAALVFLLAINGYSQKSQKNIDRQNNKVELFSDEENANLQLYFYEKTKEMNLSEEVEEDYYRILLHYVFDMQRIDDKDKDFTKDERKIELEKLVSKMNDKIKTILSTDKYEMHKSNFNTILESVYRRNNWVFKEE